MGRLSTSCVKEDPSVSRRSLGGREEMGWLKSLPVLKNRRERGRQVSIGWLNGLLRRRLVRVEGRGGRGSLK